MAVQVFDRLPNAKDYANKSVWLPLSTAIPRDPNREKPGLWASDGETWRLVLALNTSDNTIIFPPTPPTTPAIITHAHKYRIFSGEQVRVPDWHQYIISGAIIVDQGAEVITETHGVLAIV
jgi:hypothetical protein